jgi:hypothetical protein
LLTGQVPFQAKQMVHLLAVVLEKPAPSPAALRPELPNEEYCGRGDKENRLKEQQRMLFADRVSCWTMQANQLRLYLATVAAPLPCLPKYKKPSRPI